ncbi:MAG: nuclear transport factor 2 family protein [Ilumatobacteraceae bacterium]
MTAPASVEDRIAIADVTHAYCWALDSKQFDLLDEVFLPNATAELLSPLLEGRDTIRDRIRTALTPLDATQHIVTNHIVTVDGDSATCQCYLHAQHVRAGTAGGDLFVIAGRYEDKLVRTSNGWRIVFRRLVQVWSDGNVEAVRPRG